MELARKMSFLIDKKEYVSAAKLDTVMFELINAEAGMDINFNNINKPDVYRDLIHLSLKVNKYVKPTLPEVPQHLTWTFMAEDVFLGLNESFLVPSNKFYKSYIGRTFGSMSWDATVAEVAKTGLFFKKNVETLLNHTSLKIAVFNGNLDVVTSLAGASNWVHALKWHGAQEFINAKRISIRGNKNGFYKTTRQFSFWSVFGSGHWVPEDNPNAMEQILEHLIEDSNEYASIIRDSH